MALVGKIEKQPGTDGETSKFLAEFTNGTVEQLRELAAFLQKEGFTIPEKEDEKLLEVIKVGIGWLENVKNRKKGEEGGEGLIK